MTGGLESLVMLVILVGVGISQLVELVFKPLLLDAGVILPDNYRKVIIYVLLLLLGFAAAFGLDLDYAGQYLTGFDAILTALVSAAGFAGTAGVSHDLLKRLRGETASAENELIDILLPTLEYASDLGTEVLSADTGGDKKLAVG